MEPGQKTEITITLQRLRVLVSLKPVPDGPW
jgi:hypothetical protein